MIADFKTNTVYIADSTPNAFRKRLTEVGIDYKILKGTRDWFCRDYMPVQISEKEFVQFVYKPKEYHKPNEYGFISNPITVALESGLEPAIGRITYSRIILDGGNVIRATDKVIITDKVIEDNLYQFHDNPIAVIDELEYTLKSKVIIIPRYPNEKTGHADGLIRFIDDSNVIINAMPDDEDQEWLRKFEKVLNKHILNYDSRVICTVDPNQHEHPEKTENALGLYINILQLDHQIIVPRFDKKDDDDNALKDIQRAFEPIGGYTNKQMYAGDIAMKGGVLNCATWTIYQP